MRKVLLKLFNIVIKIKGTKKHFQKNIVDYSALRKDDVLFPNSKFYKKSNVIKFKILNSELTLVRKNSNNLIIYIHGGAFVSGPASHHWEVLKKLYNETDADVCMCNYPKAPENQITEISRNIDEVYQQLSSKSYEKIVLIGDSAGGTLIISLVQRLLEKNLAIPNSIILISPVLDATLSNPKIESKENLDRILSIEGVKSAKKMCAGNIDLKNPIISPLYGNFKGFPKTYLFIAENDITEPDQLIFYNKLKENNVETYVFHGKKMPHIWPILPVLIESKEALSEIIRILKT